ncbi:MAG: phosphogluconate dehydratase [Desulfobacterales bacterium]
MQKTVLGVTDRIVRRSRGHRTQYLRNMAQAMVAGPFRHQLPCSNLAHAMAVCRGDASERMRADAPHIAIISAYNDLLSAHHTYETYPAILKKGVAAAGGVAQVAAGVPAMCDGVTQGEQGMDLSLISRDVIAMATVIGLSHNVFDGALLLGICDKIVPGLLMGALQFGYLPMVLVPGGPMRTGMDNKEKARARERYAEGGISKSEMLAVESRSYHGTGTCTFYGTANSNQLIAELLGLHLPGASFVNPDDPLREAFTIAAATRVAGMTHLGGGTHTPISQVVSEKAVVNAMVGLLATGGSTNQTIHLVAVARAAGIRINWDDFSDLSQVVPLLARIYPNGPGDINAFQAAGGMAALITELLEGGLVHSDVKTVAGAGLEAYTRKPELNGGALTWRSAPERSADTAVIAHRQKPFSRSGGLKVLSGNLGRAIIKVSALADGADTAVEAPALVFHTQEALLTAFQEGRLNRSFVAVVRFQGPRATGMPELHKLITPLAVLMNRGHQVAMVTDGRLSGASGTVPAAIHVTPEGICGGMLAKVRDGDPIRLDVRAGRLDLLVDEAVLKARDFADPGVREVRYGSGRQIFASLRNDLPSAEAGASSLFAYVHEKDQVDSPFEEA